jgi:hypothetical protein
VARIVVVVLAGSSLLRQRANGDDRGVGSCICRWRRRRRRASTPSFRLLGHLCATRAKGSVARSAQTEERQTTRGGSFGPHHPSRNLDLRMLCRSLWTSCGGEESCCDKRSQQESNRTRLPSSTFLVPLRISSRIPQQNKDAKFGKKISFPAASHRCPAPPIRRVTGGRRMAPCQYDDYNECVFRGTAVFSENRPDYCVVFGCIRRRNFHDSPRE